MDGDDVAEADAVSELGHQVDRMSVEDAFRAYQSALLRMVNGIARAFALSDAVLDSEGVVQEVFVVALEQWDRVREPRAWLFALARRLAYRAFGEDARREHTALGRVAEDAAVWTSRAPQATTQDVQAARAVMEALAALPSRRKTATYGSPARCGSPWRPPPGGGHRPARRSRARCHPAGHRDRLRTGGHPVRPAQRHRGAAQRQRGGERRQLIYLKASSVSGSVIMLAIIVGLFVERARGDIGGPCAWLAGAGGLSFMAASAYFSRRR